MANTADSKEARDILNEVVDNMSITNTPKSKDRPRRAKSSYARPSTIKLKTGEEVPASEIGNYSYDEVDHSEEEAAVMAAARARNKGKNLTSMFNPSK